MNRLEWLDTATKKILFRPDRKAVRKELEAHLEDLREASGLDEETAVASMGDPAALAEELSRLHRPWWGYLWRASQIVLAGTAVFCCLLAVLAEAVCQPLDRLGTSLHNYLTPVQFTGALEERDIPAGFTISTGGCTIRADRAVLRSYEDTPQALFVDLQIGLSWRREPLILQNAWSGARTNAGEIPRRVIERSASWAFWQRACLSVEVPEDAEWVELDFGCGAWRRTLHIDLTEEAEP